MKLDRIISIATLGASLVAVVLVLKKPAPVAQPQTPAAVAANAQSIGQKMEQLERAAQQAPAADIGSYQAVPSGNQETPSSAQAKAEVHINSDEVEAALSQALGAGTGELSADSNVGSGAPTIKDQQVSFEGDLVRGQFLTVVAGKDVWVTVSGNLLRRMDTPHLSQRNLRWV